jgi:hypothetical protein
MAARLAIETAIRWVEFDADKRVLLGIPEEEAAETKFAMGNVYRSLIRLLAVSSSIRKEPPGFPPTARYRDRPVSCFPIG